MNIPKLDIFDRVELICPKPQLVSAFRTHDISKAKVYYNIFIRKFNTTKNIDELRKLLANGSFCDPTHNETSMDWFHMYIIIITNHHHQHHHHHHHHYHQHHHHHHHYHYKHHHHHYKHHHHHYKHHHHHHHHYHYKHH